jgi:hypothetical protein
MMTMRLWPCLFQYAGWLASLSPSSQSPGRAFMYSFAHSSTKSPRGGKVYHKNVACGAMSMGEISQSSKTVKLRMTFEFASVNICASQAFLGPPDIYSKYGI